MNSQIHIESGIRRRGKDTGPQINGTAYKYSVYSLSMCTLSCIHIYAICLPRGVNIQNIRAASPYARLNALARSYI